MLCDTAIEDLHKVVGVEERLHRFREVSGVPAIEAAKSQLNARLAARGASVQSCVMTLLALQTHAARASMPQRVLRSCATRITESWPPLPSLLCAFTEAVYRSTRITTTRTASCVQAGRNFRETLGPQCQGVCPRCPRIGGPHTACEGTASLACPSTAALVARERPKRSPQMLHVRAASPFLCMSSYASMRTRRSCPHGTASRSMQLSRAACRPEGCYRRRQRRSS